jgi:hypothetical protein
MFAELQSSLPVRRPLRQAGKGQRQDTMGIATSDAAGVSEKRNRGIDHGS